MFRFNHPKEAAKLREKRKVSSVESLAAKSTRGGPGGGGRGVSALAPAVRLPGAGTSPQPGLTPGHWFPCGRSAGGVGQRARSSVEETCGSYTLLISVPILQKEVDTFSH